MSNRTPSHAQLENDITAARDRLARTIDELTVRAAPKNVINRQKESARQSFYQATHDDAGQVRMDRVVIAAAAVGAVVLLKVLSSRRKAKWAIQRQTRSW